MSGNKRLKDILNYFIHLLILCFVWSVISLYADDEILDNRGAEFLTIDPFSRSAALGSGFTGVPGGVSSLFFNPAGLSLTKGDIISSTHCEWFQGIRFENLALSHSMNEKTAIGIDVKGLYTGGLEKRTRDRPSEEGTFGAYFMDFGVTYSKQLFYFLPVGVTLKGLYEKIEEYSSVGISFDIGLLYRTSINNLNIGFTLKNIGPQMSFSEEKFQLPTEMRTGVGYGIFNNNLLFNLDIVNSGKREAVVNLGSEITLLKTLSLRIGMNGDMKSDANDSKAGLSLGAGFEVGNINVDYAFVNYDFLGMTHRIGLSFTPGVTEKERKRIEREASEEARRSLEEKEQMMSSMYLKRAEELINEGEYDEAISSLDISLVWYPGNVKAISLIEKTKAEKRNSDVKVALNRGKKFFESGDFLEAIAEVDRVLELEPNNKEALKLKNEAKIRLGEVSLKITGKRKKTEDIESVFNNGVSEYSHGNYNLAIAKWQQVLELEPSRDDARSYIEKAKKKRDESITSLENKLSSLLKKKDWLGVLSIAREIKSFEPSNNVATDAAKKANSEITTIVNSNLKKAKECYNKGDIFLSEEYFRVVLMYAPGNKEAKSYIKKIEKGGEKEDADKWYLKGIDAYTTHQYKLAISYWERCLSIKPDYEKAKKNIERAQKKLIELDKAE